MMKYILLALFLVGCSNEPLVRIDASDNILNVGKYRQDQIINFRSKQ